MIHNAAEPEPAPRAGKVEVLPLVLGDIEARADAGLSKYGTRLKTFNGRNALMDLYQELIDAVMYVRQALEEIDRLNLEVIYWKSEVEKLRGDDV